ncbi:AIR synthase family protein [Halorussus gelatinilyticus]|uniref:AIR synthase family protein n=1 Tax=Halorussus gelatinilyticus TaxID=2937524 RepID=A0A8U0IFL3_9EURY|nr:AIR synthase family protein [Halorussus gelatinilyticus]UPV99465.1 AIR synthase family protein [Halorussus gelatinilyticus]
MIGKLDPDLLARVLSRTGAHDDSVILGPKYGEDAAAMRVGDQLLVVSSDPLSLAKERLGTLAVHVACNDVAASGADPRWLTNVVFLPDDDEATLDDLTTQIDEAARESGVAVVGGHSEYTPALERPMVSMTAMGLADEFVPTGGAEPGDRVVLTKGAGVEGTAVLATDFRDDLADRLPADLLVRAEAFFRDISVLPESRLVRGAATAMHDPTEGGLLTGMVELATASDVRLDVDRSAVPVREETAEICEAMGVDPLRIFGSGALLATVPESEVDGVLADLDEAGIRASEIGTVESVDESADAGVELDGDFVGEAVRDDLYDLWE